MQRAIGMVEFTSIARGIYVADQMVKVSEVEIVSSTTSCPGKYITIVTGDVAAVQTSVRLGEELAEEYYVDSIVIPNVSDSVFPAITCATMPDHMEAVGIMRSKRSSFVSETASAAKHTSHSLVKLPQFSPVRTPVWRSPRKRDCLSMLR